MKVLYVEDDPRDADVTTRMLRKTAPAIEIELAETIERALARLSQLDSAPLDLVLTDMHLSDGDGLSLLTHIRENAIPVAVVVVTGMGDEETAVAALKARADDYVVKRQDYLDRLPAILESALNHYQAESARRARPVRVLYAANQQLEIENIRRHLALHADHIFLNVVSSPAEAIYILRELNAISSYDVLLLDFELPELNALEILRDLRLSQALDIPVVLICSQSNEELASRCLERGATSYIVKRPGYLYRLPWELEDAHSRAELARREAALQESEQRFRTMADTAPVLIWMAGADKLCTYVNRFWLEFTGRTMEQELGNGWMEGVHPNDYLHCWNTYNRAFNARRSFRMEYRIRRYDGEYRWVLDTGVPRFTPDGGFIGYVGSALDIGERKEAEMALLESEERLRLAQQAARVGTWEWDVQTGAAVWSEMIWRLLGLKPDDGPATLERFTEFIHPDDREGALSNAHKIIAEGEHYHDEFRIVRSGGEILWLASIGRVIRSADGQAQRVIGVNIDITERKLAEESLKTALAEVQQLKDRLHEHNIYLQEEIRVAANFGQIVGDSQALRRVLSSAQQVSPLDTTVLILGETGTGKELLAHAIHNLSPRRKQPLVKVNCATLPAQLIETELFGHEKGAFTGADTQRAGRFVVANGGSIFLDEVGELPLDVQAKLLRVLEDGEFELVGSSRTVKVDVRVIAATNRNLADAVAQGTFRSDLYYRLSTFPITMPPLRDRREDIPMLVTHLVNQISFKLGKKIETVPQNAMAILQNYSWPGNVRELRNVLERAVIISQGTSLQLIDSLDSLASETKSQSLEREPEFQLEVDNGSETLEKNEYKLILRTLKKVHWRVEGPGGAAELLNIHASTLRSRMKKLGIERPRIQMAKSN